MADFNIHNSMPLLLDMTKPTGKPEATSAQPSGEQTQFSEFLKSSLKEVNTAQKDADRAIEELIAGESKDIHTTMIKMQQADVSLKMMMQVRNKIMDAYQEVMRTQV
ncbi:flagellar hook-basal body complex subunit FliE [Desulfurispirillum indicum S5]|uniref:Flagellar hook-basal body complex protein FliE n=1 Tax=Desulfurispirillum indicum (strain ATCC BAA-1389 / DSM 22839 / S5) TaxID=653733 RepID=E6W3P5_DESIS|nr:flagellar hook-basal body complex protein FliE [Desulfurispirillum indicum]ADU66926.1 flagellar hook-basal body complex subunit FliE [Desulfurispirillum indicum S5]